MVAPTNVTFFYQLQNMDYQTLVNRSFKFAVIDDDDANINSTQLAALSSQGKSLWAYVSAGEAETYRSYWSGNNLPGSGLLIDQNPNWPTGYRVKFWDEGWQQIVLNRVGALAREGYSGAYFDVLDVYNVNSVKQAFLATNPGGDVRKAMEDFVVRISEYAKSINPNFKIVVQNAVALVNSGVDILNPMDPLTPSERFLNAIDGLGKETTFTLGSTYPISWGPWDKRYTDILIDAGKFVVGLEFPTTAAAEQFALEQMVKAGFIPYIDDRAHNGNYADINAQVPSLVYKAWVAMATGQAVDGIAPIYGTANADTVTGSASHDVINAGAGNDVVFAQAGNDFVSAGAGNDTVYGWDGNDRIAGNAGNDLVTGDVGDDTLFGNDGDDGLYGWLGNDSISGDRGNDFLMGEQGADTLIGSVGNDTIYAGSENDSVVGDAANWSETVDGNDYLLGDDGNDSIYAGGGSDTVFGGSDNDLIFAGEGADFIGGDTGNDTIYGDERNDTLFGWTGNDSIDGGEHNDLISGEQGADTVSGWIGNDTLWGGADADRFVYTFIPNPSTVPNPTQFTNLDIIADFVRGVDQVEVAGLTAGSFAASIAPNLTYAAGHAIISFGANQTLTIYNVSGLTADDFRFV